MSSLAQVPMRGYWFSSQFLQNPHKFLLVLLYKHLSGRRLRLAFVGRKLIKISVDTFLVSL